MEEKKKKQEKVGNIAKLKESYEIIRKKYGLLDFKFMNENFEIENIDCAETELLIKQLRKHMTEKVFYILRTLEAFSNPQNAPMFIFNIIKSFSESEKELIADLYKKLAKYEIDAFGLEASYDEKKEVELIKKIGTEWKEISDDLSKLYVSMKTNHEKDNKKANKSYLG